MATLSPVVLVLMPLLILPGLLFYYDVTPKIAVLLLATGAVLMFSRENSSAIRALLQTRAGRIFAIILACQQISLTLATVFSTDPGLSLGGTNWRRYGLITQTALAVFALLLAGHFSLNPGLLMRALRATALAGCIAAAYGTLQYFGWDPVIPPGSYHVGEGEFKIVRPPSTFGHAGYFSTYLLYGLFAAIGLWGSDRWLSRCACVLIPIAILLSGTRAALLGLLAGLLVLMILKRPPLRTVAIVTLLSAACLGALLVTPAGDRLRARVHWSLEDARGGARLMLWRDSLRMAVSRLPVGTGLETFGNEFPAWQSKELSRRYPDFHHESAHNLFLDAFAAQGILGLLAWIGLCGLPLMYLHRNPALGAGFVAALVSLQFTSLTAVTALGLLFLAAAIISTNEKLERLEDSPRWRFITVAAGGALTAAAFLLILTDLRLQKMKSAIDARRADDAAVACQQALQWRWPGGSADIYYSRNMAALGRFPEALVAGRRAIETAEDRQNAFYNLAVIQAAVNDPEAVESSLKGAITVAPNWFKPHWMLAQIFALQGRVVEAEREGALAADLDAGHHPEVAETLTRIRNVKAQ